MKKSLSILALGLVSCLSAEQYYSSCPNGNCGYQGQPQGQVYYQGQVPQSQVQYHGQGSQGYYQGQAPQGHGYYQGQGVPTQGYIQEQQRDDRYNQGQPRQQDKYSQAAQYQKSNQDVERVPDQEIAKNVHELLEAGMFSKGYPNVTFQVKDGNVLLSGTVDSQDDKTKLDDKVKKLKGVQQVNNQITITGKQTSYNNAATVDDSKVQEAHKNYPQDTATTDADRRLNAKIREKISDGWFTRSYEQLTLRTNNGVIPFVKINLSI